MLKKLEHLTLTVKKPFGWPLRLVFLLFAISIAADIYELLNTGIAEYRVSSDRIREEDPFGFWTKFFEKSVMGLFFILLAVQVKEKKGE